METYDPLNAPDPDEWQSTDEQERIILVVDHHREAGVELPNEEAHATIHVIVENQIAAGDETPARETLGRMIREGLDRHDAIHAIGNVLVGYMQELAGGAAAAGANEKYNEELRKLTAAEWLDGFR
jgi:hypothetical protein